MSDSVHNTPHSRSGARLRRSPGGVWLSWCLAVAVLTGVVTIAAPTSPPLTAKEYSVKAALLIKLSQFVRWPTNSFKSPKAPFVVGILGPDPFGKELENAAADETVDKRSYRIKRSESPKDLADCQLVFITRTDAKATAAAAAALPKSGVLIVGETERFCHEGGMVSLLLVQDFPLIEINLERARAAGLEISGALSNNPRVRWADSTKR